jgi:tetratricopeptide (TPR) repeat protein
MSFRFQIVFVLVCGLCSAAGAVAQSQQQKPPAQQQPAQKPAESNPFPEDTTNVPVVPTTSQPAEAAPAPAAEASSAETTSLLRNDSDPVRSPDDPTPDRSADSGFSSSLAGSNDVNIPDEVKPTKRGRGAQPAPPAHEETAPEDIKVGEYYLDRKNWKAALSRFESALVTDPENPDVYWGLAEAQRGLGDYSNAKANYQKVVDYDDPDSKHSKDAKKLLKSPEIANAPAVLKNQPTGQAQPQ